MSRLLRRRSSRILFIGVCLIATVGCGSATIQGTITLDGEPLAGAQVLFDQPETAGGKSFAGRSDSQGRYQLHGLDENSRGAVAGRYRVTLTTAVAERTALEHTPLPPERVPAKYRGGSLQFEVPEGGTEQADFALTSR